MSGLNDDKKMSLKTCNINRLLSNIEKLKLITEKIAKFKANTPLNILENHLTLLETFWLNCVSASFDVGSDIPYDSYVFWWQTNGDQHYHAAREKMIEFILTLKMNILTKSQTFQSFHKLTYQIYNLDEMVTSAVLDLSLELLDRNWLTFSEAYYEIIKGHIAPSLVANVYNETESYYINAKLKIKNMSTNKFLSSFESQVAQNYNVHRNVNRIVEPAQQYNQNLDIVEQVQQPSANQNLDGLNEIFDTMLLKRNEGLDLDGPITNISNQSISSTFKRSSKCKRKLVSDELTTHIKNRSIFSTMQRSSHWLVGWVRILCAPVVVYVIHDTVNGIIAAHSHRNFIN